MEKEASAAIKAGRFDHASVTQAAELKASNAKTLSQDDEFYWNAFLTITTMRDTGVGATRLRWDDCMKYADRYGLTIHESEMLWSIIRAMDDVVMADNKAKSAAK
ncbi:phage tail assembly chaperone [Sphingobium lactosutens]|uniref:phage tail assembly chaperone n=1 Tax=Sphingobium lactosutens TaxID=522773 RepID=UPI0015C08447|nr:hypothetical protein [Sphingobium lactosutens]